MRPQKMNASGHLSSFSSLYRPNSKPSGKHKGADGEVELIVGNEHILSGPKDFFIPVLDPGSQNWVR